MGNWTTCSRSSISKVPADLISILSLAGKGKCLVTGVGFQRKLEVRNNLLKHFYFEGIYTCSAAIADAQDDLLDSRCSELYLMRPGKNG